MKSKFWEFEHTNWETSVEQYHSSFGKLTNQIISSLLASVAPKKHEKLLDLACGPGYVALEASSLGANVIGVDFSKRMIDKAKILYPKIKFLEGDVEELKFEDESFDIAVMNFGILHLGNPEKAVSEAYRILKKGGRYAFTIWAKPDEAVGFKAMMDSIKEGGNLDVDIPPALPFFHFSERENSFATLSKHGFKDLKFQKIEMDWILDSPSELFDAFYKGTARTGGLLRLQTKDNLDRIKEISTKKAENFKKNNSITIPMPAIVVSGTR